MLIAAFRGCPSTVRGLKADGCQAKLCSVFQRKRLLIEYFSQGSILPL